MSNGAKRDVVLITGSSGLIGTAVARRLSRDFEVVGFDVEAPQDPKSVAEFIYVDMSADASVEHGLYDLQDRHGDRIAAVIHLAAYYDFSGEPSDKYETITVRGTERLIRGLQNFQVGQFVFSSTMLVHAPCEPGERIDETWPLKPAWDYPKSKVDAENVILKERGEIPAALLRIAGVYDDYCHSIPLANQIQRIYERKMTAGVFPGDTSRGQAFIHLDDLVEALRRVVEARQNLPRKLALLVGEPVTLSYETLQQEFARLIHGEEWTTRQIPKAVAKAGAWFEDVTAGEGEEPFIKPWMVDLADEHYELDLSRSIELLGWAPEPRLLSTLPKMVDALKKDPVAWYRENKLDLPANLEKKAA